MTFSTLSIIGFIVAGLTGLAGAGMLLRGWQLRSQEWRQLQPRLPFPGEEPVSPRPPGHSGTTPPRTGCYRCGAELKPSSQFCPHCGRAQVIAKRYKIVRQIGQGGMGAVYLVEDQRLKGKQWAMKQMSDAGITNPLDRQHAIEAFQKEAELLARLEHTNLPTVIDFLSQGSNHYLVMDYIEGDTLEVLLTRRRKPFSEAEVLAWARQLCNVLSYLHSQTPSVIFRDLKPSNIMLMPTGQIRLIDFGIARLFKSGKSGDTAKLGTPGYAAPEQFGGQGQTDARSDIYALGVTLHQLLTGYDPTETPFTLPKVRRLNPAVSVQVEQAIEQATQSEVRHRFQTVAALEQALGLD